MSKQEVVKVTAKSIIVAGIEAGRKTDVIINNVLKKIPDSKADASHVKHYAGVLCRAGDIDAETASKYGYTLRGAATPKTKTSAKAEAKTGAKVKRANVVADEEDDAAVTEPGVKSAKKSAAKSPAVVTRKKTK